LTAGDVGKIAICTSSGTPANVSSYCRLLKDNLDGSFVITQPGTFAISATPFTLATPQIGDVFDVVDLPTLNVGKIVSMRASQSAIAALPTRNTTVFDSLIPSGGTSAFTCGIETNHEIFFTRSVIHNLFLSGTGNFNYYRLAGGGGGLAGSTSFASIVGAGAFLETLQTGFLDTGVSISAGGTFSGRVDTYFQNSQLFASAGARISTRGIAFHDRLLANTTVVVFQGGVIVSASSTVGDWGTNNAGFGLDIRSGGFFSYTGTAKPSINSGLGVGREARIGGTDKLYANVPYIEGANGAALALV